MHFRTLVSMEKPVRTGSRRYLMLNKPAGVVSATVDTQHTTVIDLLTEDYRAELHIVGRLDFNATGLVLLTNDGRWSQKISQPGSKLLKRYRVTVENPLTPEYVSEFQRGMYFSYEDITTRPAELTILSDYSAGSRVSGRPLSSAQTHVWSLRQQGVEYSPHCGRGVAAGRSATRWTEPRPNGC